MKKLFVLSAVIASLALTACSPQTTNAAEQTQQAEQAQQTVQAEMINDTPEEFENQMQGEYLLLDVRTQEEYDEGHIEGATLIPVTELESRLDEISDYKDMTVLVYCRSGNRSVTASNILLENGFTQVHNLLGGIGAWNSYKGE